MRVSPHPNDRKTITTMADNGSLVAAHAEGLKAGAKNKPRNSNKYNEARDKKGQQKKEQWDAGWKEGYAEKQSRK